MKKINFLDLKLINKEYKHKLIEEFDYFLDNGWYILGSGVSDFENEYKLFNKTNYAIGVANGLDALILSLKGIGINEKDEIIVPTNTYIATWLAISHLGAIPVPVEPFLDTYNLDHNKIESKITNKTKAILVVNLYGQAAQLDIIKKIAIKYKLFLIEDNAQSQGALCCDKMTGTFGDVNATSFYPGKNLGALGDAGLITTDINTYYEKICYLRNYGSKIKYYNEYLGYNSRLDELQARFLSIKLKNLIRDNLHRKNLAMLYDTILKDCEHIILPKIAENCTSVYHIYMIRTRNRDELMNYLNQKQIQTMIHYPIPPHLQKAYVSLNFKKGSFPIAEEIAETCLSLPIGPHLTLKDVEIVSNEILNFFKNHK